MTSTTFRRLPCVKRCAAYAAIGACLVTGCSSDAPSVTGESPDVELGAAMGTDELAPNFAPDIVESSYRCETDLESVLFNVGDTETFTLNVNDEFPHRLEYFAQSSASDAFSVSVNDEGEFAVTALQAGEAYLWLSVSDHEGLVDEYEMQITVR